MINALLTSDNIAPLRHGFFTREGGVSGGLYASLNCGPGSGDAGECVRENRERARAALGAAHLCTLHQVHGAEAVLVTEPWALAAPPRGDALVTDAPGIALGVLTADCAPVLLADRDARVIGAAHAGWKGAFCGVLEAALAAMESLGARRGSIAAAIGPAIAQSSYEVGAEFYARFLEAGGENARFFVAASPSSGEELKYRFDLPAYVRHRLEKAGVSDINMLEHDTCREDSRFFSYRRAALRGQPDYGRQLSCIMIGDER